MRRRSIISFACAAALAAGTLSLGTASAHEYSVGSSITINRSSSGFSGSVISSRGQCKRGRSVQLIKARRKKPHRVAGSTTSGAGGSWSISKPRPRGRYYVRITRRVRTPYGHRHDCGGDRSRTIFVR